MVKNYRVSIVPVSMQSRSSLDSDVRFAVLLPIQQINDGVVVGAGETVNLDRELCKYFTKKSAPKSTFFRNSNSWPYSSFLTWS